MEAKALSFLSAGGIAEFESTVNSPGSSTIRAGLIGIRMSFSASGAGKTHVSITLNEKAGLDENQCSEQNFSGDFDSKDMMKSSIVQGFGHLVCLDKVCSSVLLVLEHSRNQASTSKGVFDAAVPIIMEDTSKDGKISSGTYAPTASEDSAFMRFEDDITVTCKAPVESQSYSGPILPDTYQPGYDYFPDDNNDIWMD
jgi:hypothetical protein